MRKGDIFAIVLLLLAVGGWWYVSQPTCKSVLHYSLGNFDENFGISQEEFLSAIVEAESIWEKEVGRELFELNSEADFSVNLVFDERQQFTDELSQSESTLSGENEVIDTIQDQYDSLRSALESEQSIYKKKQSSYVSKLEQYNEDVVFWNSQGGADKETFARLEERRTDLEEEFNALEKLRLSLNAQVDQTNSLAEQLRNEVSDYNLQVGDFNEQYGEEKRFQQGLYSGDEITIYQFQARDDLIAVLAHELGHALGIDHVRDPKAVMYELMDEETVGNLELTLADRQALSEACPS